MAFGKTATCIALLGAAAFGAQFTVMHDHFPQGGCNGVMTVDGSGVTFQGPKGHSWKWPYEEMRQLKLDPRGMEILSYPGRRFHFTGAIPATELYPLLNARMDQRFVAAVGQESDTAAWSVPVHHQGRRKGSEGTLSFGADTVLYNAAKPGESRTWRYTDIDNISSSDRFQLTITTREKGFQFQLKQPITEGRYNQLWLDIEKKNGRIQ